MAVSTTSSKLLLLPAEIRLRIFSYLDLQQERSLCPCDRGANVPLDGHLLKHDEVKNPAKAAIMLVSKRMASETRELAPGSFRLIACSAKCISKAMDVQEEALRPWFNSITVENAISLPPYEQDKQKVVADTKAAYDRLSTECRQELKNYFANGSALTDSVTGIQYDDKMLVAKLKVEFGVSDYMPYEVWEAKFNAGEILEW